MGSRDKPRVLVSYCRYENDHGLGDLMNSSLSPYSPGGQKSEISLTGLELRCG